MLPICTKTKAMAFIGISVIYHLSFGVCFVCCFLIQLNTIWFDEFGCTNLQLKRHIMRFNRMKLNVRHIQSIYILAMEIILASIFSNEYVKLTHALFKPQIKSTPMLYTKKRNKQSVKNVREAQITWFFSVFIPVHESKLSVLIYSYFKMACVSWV